MIFDQTNMFSNRQTVTTAAASTNVIDRGVPGIPKHGRSPGFRHDVGKGTDVKLAVILNASFTGTSLAFMRLRYQVCAAEGFGSGVEEPVDLFIPVASLLVSNRFSIPLDTVPLNANLRYHRLHYAGLESDRATAVTFTTGQITAGVVAGRDEWWK